MPTSTTYFELRADDGAVERLDVNNVEAAKTVAKTVAKLTGRMVTLNKISEIDLDAPPRTRSTSSS